MQTGTVQTFMPTLLTKPSPNLQSSLLLLHLWSNLCRLHSPQQGNSTSSANPYDVTQVSVESFWPLCLVFQLIS